MMTDYVTYPSDGYHFLLLMYSCLVRQLGHSDAGDWVSQTVGFSSWCLWTRESSCISGFYRETFCWATNGVGIMTMGLWHIHLDFSLVGVLISW